jgi:hypothetical protein
MKRSFFLFSLLFVAACSGKLDADGVGGGSSTVDGTSDGTSPWGEPSASDASTGDPWADAAPWDPSSDGGTIDPADASADGSHCGEPPPPPPPPCADASVPDPTDASVDPDAG